jgi:hypothetical protein
MNHWLEREVHRLIQGLDEVTPGTVLHLYCRRGSVVASRAPLEGYERATSLRLPWQSKSKEELAGWIQHELKSIPCFP